MSDLQLARGHRQGYQTPGGGGKSERHFLEFVVDGRGLSSVFSHDLIGCLGWLPPVHDARVVEALLGNAASREPHRVYLYICPECGDRDCGSVTVEVQRDVAHVTWRTFAYEHPAIDGPDFVTFAHLGPFHFPADTYERVLNNALRRDLARDDSAL